jgi:protein-tyrosine kinase
MGYVFDAMNRPDDENRPKKDGEESLTPSPDGSEPVVGDTADTPPHVSESEGTGVQPPATPDEDAPVFNFSEARSTEIPQPGPPAVDVPQDIETFTFDPPAAAPQPQSPTPPPLCITSQWAQELDDRLVALTEPSSQLAEEYRAIRTTLLARWEHRRNLVHTITSATPQEGKTITSLNLGLIMAELRNRKTIVIEADLRLPTFNKLLHLGESKGLIAYLRGEASLGQIIQKLENNPLHVITAGSRASNDAVQLLSNQRMASLLKVLRSKYDHVIIDTPPVIELADAGILGGLSDEVMLIARISRTPKPLIEQALRALRNYNAPVAGVIATDQERGKNRYHYYRYGYRYRYRYYAKRAA